MNSYLIQIPEQIIIPLLPIPNMTEPINAITVSYKKKLSQDWFRDFFLPQARIKLERSIAPLRRNSGKLIICLLYTSPSPRDRTRSRMPSSA